MSKLILSNMAHIKPTISQTWHMSKLKKISNHVLRCWVSLQETRTKFKQKKISTFNAWLRSSLVWAAEMQIRALPKNTGVAGNPTDTTATCTH
jgi:uncharacterized membrane protein SirB2